MVVYVLPQLLVIFKESGISSLPITTRALIAITDFVNSYLIFVLGFIAVVIGGSLQYVRTPDGSRWWDEFKIKVPLFGSIMKGLYLTRIELAPVRMWPTSGMPPSTRVATISTGGLFLPSF